ncbi:hypothetical protein F-VV10_0038 [Faustovirus]|nr:hypothetical protein F-VV10_0038 [Faustovirus]
MENTGPVSVESIATSGTSTESQSPRIVNRGKLLKAKSSFSVAFDKHVKNDNELVATVKTAKQVIKHILKGKMTLTVRMKLLRKLIRRFTNLVLKDSKFKIVIPLDIVDYIKSFTDLI